MTLYSTNKRTGEMTPLDLTPLKRKPPGRTVKRIQHTQAHTTDDAVLILAGLNLLALALVLVT